MSRVDLIGAHRERVTIRVGDVYIKVQAEAWRAEREAEALAFARVPTPQVEWTQPHVLAVRAVAGGPLAQLVAPSAASGAAWRAAGDMARRIHEHALPPWAGWDWSDYASHLDKDAQWLVDEAVLTSPVVAAARERASVPMRPWDPVFIHGDLQAAHVLVEADGVTGIIDWEDAEAGDPHFDIAVLTVGHEERLPDVLAGYEAELDIDIIHGWWAYRRLTSVRWMIEHDFDASGDIEALRRTVDG